MNYEEMFDLKNMIERAFQEEDIANGLRESGLVKNSIVNKLNDKFPEILKIFSVSIEKIENLLRQKENLELTLLKEHPILCGLYDFKESKPRLFWIALSVAFFILSLTLFDFILFPILFSLIGFFLYKYYSFDRKDYNELKNKILFLENSIETSLTDSKYEIYTNGILPEIRSLINAHLNPSYFRTLTPLMTLGITGIFEPRYEIPTEPKNRLSRILDIMPNGSIGIAGPRGAGKSTLMSSFCGGWIEGLNDKKVLTVMTSAPVDYEPRDFLLHLFSLVCKKVLELKGEPIQTYVNFSNNFHKSSFLDRHFFNIDTLFGLALIFFSLIFIGKTNFTFLNDNSSIELPFSRSSFYTLISTISLTLGSLLLFRVYLNSKQNREKTFSERNKDEIVKKAKHNLQIIKFQSSFSSGWSGALKFPFGITEGINSASTLSTNLLSSPEIVDIYREFIKSVSKDYEIYIGIDELDKISSNDKAYCFLNEIKGIFNLDHCYYFISVSENAISTFSKRGMPFRDAFDSSFDDIIYVDYLNYNSSKELIKRRIIGMPVPFMCLCYLMSGGLARDLIRVCRDLLEFLELDKSENSLNLLSKKVIRKDIMSKINAVKIDGKKIDFDEGNLAQKLIEEIYLLERSVEIEPSFWKSCLNIISLSNKLTFRRCLLNLSIFLINI